MKFGSGDRAPVRLAGVGRHKDRRKNRLSCSAICAAALPTPSRSTRSTVSSETIDAVRGNVSAAEAEARQGPPGSTRRVEPSGEGVAPRGHDRGSAARTAAVNTFMAAAAAADMVEW